jgi:pyrimidine 5'-nucleotidase
MRFSTVFFDLDDTLYPASSGLWQVIKHRIGLYMRERMGIPEADIPRLQMEYYQRYGTSLRGLEIHYNVDRLDYLAFVHDVPLADYLSPNPILREALAALPTRRLILTNADAAHAQRVTTYLQIADLFDGIVDVNAMHPHCKPHPEAIQVALRIANEADPTRCAIVDDLPRTTHVAREQGFFTVLYGFTGPHPDADATFTDWRDLPGLLNGDKP